MLDRAHDIADDKPGIFANPGAHSWTTREEAILRSFYPKLGAVGCRELLPRHSVTAINQRARMRNVRFAGKRTTPHPKMYTTNEHFDALIIRTYQGKPRRGQVAALAQTLGRPRQWITQRAAELGVIAVRVKEPDWSDRELEIITEAASLAARTIVAKLRREGFTRSANAVVLRLSRMKIDRGESNAYSTPMLAMLMGVHEKTVWTWIKTGLLKAHRRTRDEGGPGVAFEIPPTNVRRFIVANAAAVDIRKVDKQWFIDLLAKR